MSAASTHAAWQAEMGKVLPAIQAEAGGTLIVHIVSPADAPALIAAAASGNTEAIRLLNAVEHAIAGIEAAPRHRRMLCATCPRPLRKGAFAIGAAMPATTTPSKALTLAVCTRCATTPDAILAKATQAFRRFWPDMRAFEITHPEGGRA